MVQERGAICPHQYSLRFHLSIVSCEQAETPSVDTGGHRERGSANTSAAAQHPVPAGLLKPSSRLGHGSRGNSGKNYLTYSDKLELMLQIR